jgi:predicted SAM-dependent methyltransferase
MSPIAQFLKEKRGIEIIEVTTDLRDDWPLQGESVDAVFSLEVMEHLHDKLDGTLESLISFSANGPRKMFTEAYRILRPGGRLFLTTPNANSIDAMLNIAMLKHPFIYAPHVREYTVDEVGGMATAVGFKIELCETIDAWPNYQEISRAWVHDFLALHHFKVDHRGNDLIAIFRKVTAERADHPQGH